MSNHRPRPCCILIFNSAAGIGLLEFFLTVGFLLLAVGIAIPWLRAQDLTRAEKEAEIFLLALGTALEEQTGKDHPEEQAAPDSWEEILAPPLGTGSVEAAGEYLEEKSILRNNGYFWKWIHFDGGMGICGWPVHYAHTAHALYLYHPERKFLYSRNDKRSYSGLQRQPKVSTAFPSQEVADRLFSKDGQEWKKPPRTENREKNGDPAGN